MSINIQKVTQLIAHTTAADYDISDLEIKLSLGGSAECSFALMGKHIAIPHIRVQEAKNEDILPKDFAYGDKVDIKLTYMDGGKDVTVTIFTGYVLNTGAGEGTISRLYDKNTTIVLGNAVDVYRNEFTAKALYLTNDFTTIPRSAVSKLQYAGAEDSYLQKTKDNVRLNIRDLCIATIDGTAELDRSAWPKATTAERWVKKLADIVDTSTTLVMELPVINVYVTKSLIKEACVKQSDSVDGYLILEKILSEFFLTPVPAGTTGKVRFIPRIAITTDRLTDVKVDRSKILQYQYYPAQARYDHYTAVAVHDPLSPSGAAPLCIVSMGHDDKQNPKVTTLNRTQIVNAQSGSTNTTLSALLTSFGAMKYITLPIWTLPEDTLKDKSKEEAEEPKGAPSNDMEKERIELGTLLAKATLASGGEFSGKLVIDLVPDPETYNKLVNYLGYELLVNLKNSENSYGRIVNVHYAINPLKDKLKLVLRVTLDCVVNEAEYETFKISPKDLGFTENGNK